jgi:hypothetical protein
MNESSTFAAWPDAAQEFLRDLLAVQNDLLTALREHRQPKAIEPVLVERLQQCHRRRAELLDRACKAGLPSQTLRDAVAALTDTDARRVLASLIAEAQSAGRRTRLASLTQWMLAQRSLAHVGQLLEILATGTPQPPTYGNGAVPTHRGGLLDQAA